MKDNTGPARKFAVPSICRRYHSGFVSFSKTDSSNFSAPSAKWPQTMTMYAHALRSPLATTLAPSTRRHRRKLRAGKTR